MSLSPPSSPKGPPERSRRRRTFPRGGVDVHEHKECTAKLPVETIPPPAEVVIPMAQHFGVPCEPVVQRGETVRKGQLIGSTPAPFAADVHASVAGKVKAVGPHVHPSGFLVESVTIETDPAGETEPALPPVDPGDRAAVLRRIREMGVVGMGGAGFPTAVKLNPPGNKPIDTLLLNGAECEPYLTADHRLMVEDAPRVLEGLRVMRTVLGNPRAVIAVEDNKPDAADALAELVGDDPSIELLVLKTRYPQGAERQLIESVLGRTVPSGGLPMDVGVDVQNVGTAAAVADAVLRGRPLIERVLTVSGDGVRQPKNLRVPIGALYGDLMEHCGGMTEDASRVIMGGPMMGKAQPTVHIPVTKGTSGILVLTPRTARPYRELRCVRCGECLRVCPQGLVPTELAVLAEREQFASLTEIMDCVECGACNYACPANRQLVQWIRFGKVEYRNLQKKKRHA